MIKIGETRNAVLLIDNTNPDKLKDEEWFPKSQIKLKPWSETGCVCHATIPVWLLAKRKWKHARY